MRFFILIFLSSIMLGKSTWKINTSASWLTLHPYTDRLSSLNSGISNPKGVISHLGNSVTLSAGGYLDSNYPITNITSYNDKYFFNYYINNPRSEAESFIKFDFGPSKIIDLYSYFIRSNCSDPSCFAHPKTWRIEGSNDDSNWFTIDRRENNENLNGKFKYCNFECNENNHADKKNMYRYIRYIQEDSWDHKNRCYNIYITYFELYGDIFNI